MYHLTNKDDDTIGSSQINVENSNQMSSMSSSQFEKLDWVELDNNYFRSEVSLGATSTQKGEDYYHLYKIPLLIMSSIFLERPDWFEQLSNGTIIIGSTNTSGNEVSHTGADGLSSNTHITIHSTQSYDSFIKDWQQRLKETESHDSFIKDCWSQLNETEEDKKLLEYLKENNL